jgi:hypothetical protein
MKKRTLVLAMAGAFAASGAAFAEGVSVNGFIDGIYTISDEAADNTAPDIDGNANSANPNESTFSTSGELDFTASMGSVAARIDLDVNGGVSTEQVYGAWNINDSVALMFGKFNNPMGFEAEDAPDMYQTSHSLLWDVLDGQTSLSGNNVEGAAVKAGIGAVTVVGALLNDVNGAPDNNSFMGLVALSPIEGLDLELSFLTQEDNNAVGNPNSAEGVTDFNAAYSLDAAGMPVKVWLDYLTAGALVDSAYSIGGMVGVGGNVSLTLRFDNVSSEDSTVDDTEATTLAAAWAAADNLAFLLEWRNDDNGTDDFDTMTLEGVVTF